MATSLVRSGFLRSALRGRARSSQVPKRNFASSGHHDDAYETAKWEKITYLGIVGCTGLAVYNLSKGHPHFKEPPQVPMDYLKRSTTTSINGLMKVFVTPVGFGFVNVQEIVMIIVVFEM
ncbi:Cytochrome c oxidase subunit 6a, mitochondrial isoform C [Glycine soja]|uniref:Cytochrome c oxidase subunit 6a, mitochondrial isoform C n=1 Tax=Glycine soja TaxID=3848 RepID=A0A445G7B0_GLYSO|nr:Cytochrome c oxidase subunit 6a, mitochondrial isoform C [Glycine soja]